MEVGGWVTQNVFFKSSQNSSKPVLICWSSTYHAYSVCIYRCTLLKVVSYYDLSVLSMLVMGFQKKDWMDGVSSIRVYFGFLENVLTMQSPLAFYLSSSLSSVLLLLTLSHVRLWCHLSS